MDAIAQDDARAEEAIAVARSGAADRMRAYGAAGVVDYTAVPVPEALQRAHPDGIDVLIDVASDFSWFRSAVG